MQKAVARTVVAPRPLDQHSQYLKRLVLKNDLHPAKAYLASPMSSS
jgi:hypothetical protein